MLAIKIADINFSDRLLTIHGKHSKNHKTQAVVIPRPLMDLLYEHKINTYPKSYYLFGKNGGEPSDEKLYVAYFGNIFRKYLIRLGFDLRMYKMYSIKNTGIIQAIKSGIDLVSIQRQVRHHSLDQLNQYLTKVGAINCDDLHEKFPNVDSFGKKGALDIGTFLEETKHFLKMLNRTDVLKKERVILSEILTHCIRIIG